jgi:hypothetical protein
MKQRGMGCATKGGGCCAKVGKAKKMSYGGSVKKMKYGGMACKKSARKP